MRAAASIAIDVLFGVPLICICIAITWHQARAAERCPIAGEQEWP